MLRAIYGISSAGSTDDWPAKARPFVDILIQGSRPQLTASLQSAAMPKKA
jgi:hypothetical protein